MDGAAVFLQDVRTRRRWVSIFIEFIIICFVCIISSLAFFSEEIRDLDISLPNRPEQSDPMNIAESVKPGRVPVSLQRTYLLKKCLIKYRFSPQVLIEAGSASSMELSPHFANFRQHSGSVSSHHGREHHSSGTYHGDGGSVSNKVTDVASELQDAMSETVMGEETLLDGKFLCVEIVSLQFNLI